MQNISKILMILCLCFLANIAVAEDEDIISLERLEQIKEENEYWLQFLAQALYYSPGALARLAFAKKHFTPLWYEIITNDKGQKVAKWTCFDNEAEKTCPYRLKAPIKLKGTLTIKPSYTYFEGCDDIPMDVSFENEDLFLTEMKILTYSNLQIKPTSRNQKEVLAKIPKWLLDGFAGEVSYEVEFEVANMSGYISDVWSNQQQDIALIADYSACGSGSYLVADNIKFIKKLSEKKYEVLEQYLEAKMISANALKVFQLKTNDDFVNLRESPNGVIIARIYKKF
ncbi:Uncharacterised protein [Helicobacter fennelliae]|uniref:Periplasmic protein n=1 Tax=Helicobacter fennelliae TaxID=215 RepID=A0A2X3BEY6_9HELI|nr:hypothetical protein [Helicobacter fennelliae]SQB98344.1 Uncharacterised protein [Helicobacter fennelliae]